MSEHKPKIIAKSAEEFNEINEKLLSLPNSIYNQISEAQRESVLLPCKIRCKFNNLRSTESYAIPSDVTHIKDFGKDSTIIVYCKDFLFEINRQQAFPIGYVFIPFVEINK